MRMLNESGMQLFQRTALPQTSFNMGAQASTIRTGGTLDGAYPPPLTTNLPVPDSTVSVSVTIPPNKLPGHSFLVTYKGQEHVIRVKHPMKPGQTINIKLNDTTKIYASTLHSLPGMEIVQARPLVYGSVSHAFTSSGNGYGQQDMGNKVGSLMQKAQHQILMQAAEVGCNAVLAMSFNVTNDSSGQHGNHKNVVVTVCGTPCSVVKTGQGPVIEADVIVEPLYYTQVSNS